MTNLFDKITLLRQNGLDLVSVFVTQKEGSGPVNVGKKMIIASDNQAFGTIGGGAIEYYARNKCKEILNNKCSLNEKYYLSDTRREIYLDLKSLPMACGGKVTLFYEYLPATFSNNAFIYDKIDELRNKGRDLVLITITESEDGLVSTKLLFDEYGIIYGDIIDDEFKSFIVDNAKEALSKRGHLTSSYKTNVVFFEFVGPRQYVYIFGGGHCGQALARVLRPLGFFIQVIDDRKSVIDCFDSAHLKHESGFVDFIANNGIRQNSLVVVCTPSHANDYHVLNKIVKENIKLTYFGMLCSKNKLKDYIELTYKEYGKSIDLSNFYSPIGLQLGDNSPEDIAISIAAEMLEVLSGYKKSRHMRELLEDSFRYWEK